ncbi:AAA family ATPase [Nocardioides marinquilinus]|uniref:AAA family ATPase n=1 Tax=Nocardioides marinquilinus TaxID=1210400 RepID=A0ABP9PBL3_9ACTN
MPAPDAVLRAEQSHLTRSRAALARMRQRVDALDPAAGGDRISREVLAGTLEARRQALADDPQVPLFFGRLDYDVTAEQTPDETFHVGRRHVSDEGGDPLVVDWRAPVSLPFYRASRTEPMGLRRRRRYGFSAGAMTSFEDERLAEGDALEHSAILEAEIERPRTGPMRDIVATIQPEQDVIVRAGLDRSVCVQGAPGTGKTAVGLHRAAFLLYAFRRQLARGGVLVVGPNASFLRYIGDVLPALGELDARQTTPVGLCLETLTGRHPKAAVRADDDPAAAVLKGDARMAEVLRRAVWGHVTAPTEGLVVPRGSSRWRVSVLEVEDLLAELRERGVRYGAARAMLPQRLAHLVLLQMERRGESPDDRVQDAVARSRPVKACVDALWPAVDPARLVLRLTSDAELLAAAADGLLSADEQAMLLRPGPARAPGTARWTPADVVLVDEAADLVEREPSWGHVVVDEAQDLSPMMLRAVGRRATTGSVTVLGDLAQATTPWGVRDWREALAHLGHPDAVVDELTRGFRVPGEVIELAARLLPHVAPGLAPPVSVRRTPGELVLRRGVEALPDVVREVVARPGSVGVIAPDARVAEVVGALAEHSPAALGGDPGPETDPRLQVVPATLAKGLEFDHVVLVEPAALVAAEPDRATGLRRLYVCLTRAVTSLVVLHDDDLPAELAAPA